MPLSVNTRELYPLLIYVFIDGSWDSKLESSDCDLEEELPERDRSSVTSAWTLEQSKRYFSMRAVEVVLVASSNSRMTSDVSLVCTYKSSCFAEEASAVEAPLFPVSSVPAVFRLSDYFRL